MEPTEDLKKTLVGSKRKRLETEEEEENEFEIEMKEAIERF